MLDSRGTDGAPRTPHSEGWSHLCSEGGKAKLSTTEPPLSEVPWFIEAKRYRCGCIHWVLWLD